MRSISVILVLLMFAGCATPPGPKATIGSLGGAAAGGLMGAAISGEPLAIAAGVILGGLTGAAVGDVLDYRDRQYVQQATYHALQRPPHRPTRWQNPQSRHSGWVQAQAPYQNGAGQTCREYTSTIYVGGETRQGVGVACLQEDGSWRIQ